MWISLLCYKSEKSTSLLYLPHLLFICIREIPNANVTSHNFRLEIQIVSRFAFLVEIS